MSIKAARFAKLVGIVAAAAALSSPALVNAEPHGGGGGHASHFEGRGGGGRAVGHAYVGRGYGGAYAHAYRGGRYGAYAGPRAAWGARGWGGYRAAWGGGWWGGYYWPAASYGWNYPWFLATLPLGYATYWWGGVPYYYVDDVYYSWNPADSGYVVTDPPPIDAESAPAYDPSADPAEDATPPPARASSPSASPDDVYMYPKNGQSAQQQATDRYACHKWAQEQTGFDPTQSAAQSSGNAFDYHRAMVACLTGRGYSVN